MPFDFGEEAVNSGEFASVSCSVHKGDLPIEIVWYHNNESVIERNGLAIMKNKKVSTLSIDSVSFESAGEYTCVARNRAGYTSHSAVLNVNGIFESIACIYLIKINFIKLKLLHK